MRRLSILLLLTFTVVVLAACSGANEAVDTSVPDSTSTSLMTSTVAPTTSTELTTTAAPILTVAVTGDGDPELGAALGQLYSYWLDDRNPQPNAPEGLMSFLASLPAPVGDLTDAGSYTGSASPVGTFDQGGNVFEWNEAIISGSSRGVRGGSFFNGDRKSVV